MIPSETSIIESKFSTPVVLSILDITFISSLLYSFKISLAASTSSLQETNDNAM